MERAGERDSCLLETAVAIAIVALLAGSALGSALGAFHATSGAPIRDALHAALRREMPIAIDVLKYRGSNVAPVSVATTLPMPGGSPIPARLSLQTTHLSSGSVRIAIAAVATVSGQRATLTAVLGDRAPLPGSVVHAPGLVPMPTGAP